MVLTMRGESLFGCRPEISDLPGGQKSYPINDSAGRFGKETMARLKLSHTVAEHQLYEALLNEANNAQTRVCAFSTRKLMTLAQLPNYSAVRRALQGLIHKLSIEEYKVIGDLTASRKVSVYLVYSPEEILTRRASSTTAECDESLDCTYGQAVERVADSDHLSRREAQVALCCVEGLTNTEIGSRLHISVQTVKYHLRHIFVKYKVKRRTELVSRLLAHSGIPQTSGIQTGQ